MPTANDYIVMSHVTNQRNTNKASDSSHFPLSTWKRFFKLSFNFLIYLTAPDLTCGMWDIVPWPGIEPPGHLHWECGVLATGLPGKSLTKIFCLFVFEVQCWQKHLSLTEGSLNTAYRTIWQYRSECFNSASPLLEV